MESDVSACSWSLQCGQKINDIVRSGIIPHPTRSTPQILLHESSTDETSESLRPRHLQSIPTLSVNDTDFLSRTRNPRIEIVSLGDFLDMERFTYGMSGRKKATSVEATVPIQDFWELGMTTFTSHPDKIVSHKISKETKKWLPRSSTRCLAKPNI